MLFNLIRLLCGYVTMFTAWYATGDSSPPSDISSWFKAVGYGSTGIYSLQIAHDMYAIGCQVGGTSGCGLMPIWYFG